VEIGDVGELAHGAVGLVGVEDQIGEIHPLHEVRGQRAAFGPRIPDFLLLFFAVSFSCSFV
jgi:hypothetical protein